MRQAGLADPGFAGQQHRVASPGFGLLPGLPQCRQFRFTSYDLPQLLPTREKAALVGFLPQDTEHRNGMLISLEPALASSFDGEAGSKQPPRRCGDHDFPAPAASCSRAARLG